MGKKKQKFKPRNFTKNGNEFMTAPLSNIKHTEEPCGKNDEGSSDDDSDKELRETRLLVQKQNRKNKKSGGFQSMGLSNDVFKGITRKGYKIPTPIQRKTIPIILDGKDVVAMARTGSGKSAAFLIPLFEKLKIHSTKSGARALIMSPTRELALQTLKFAKELGRFTSLRFAVILGGDRMEDQFSAMHENPDVIITTPGRFLHVVMEMDLKLYSVEYVVFDEADRLFEMGFQEQLLEVLKRLPESRQTLLFSATLPKLLVEFARAGLHDPTLIRLDVDTKLSENLELSFLHCRTSDKVGVLLYLLRSVINREQQTVVFTATKHHVEYLQMLLSAAGIESSYIYSSLDATARKINIGKFQYKKTSVMIVTDLAARGIDIPMLDYVINYNFPPKSKLFVHRVGRVARAGRSGTAISLVAPDELPYVLDLHLFLGRPLNLITKPALANCPQNGCHGRVPQSIVDNEVENVKKILEDVDIDSQFATSEKAYTHYVRSRPAPSSESIKRVKEMNIEKMAIHPLFASVETAGELDRMNLLYKIKNYEPQTTIFEVNKSSKSQSASIMRTKRNYHGSVIDKNKQRQKGYLEKSLSNDSECRKVETSAEEDIEGIFSSIIQPSVPGTKRKPNPTDKAMDQRSEFYIPYKPKDDDTERGYSVNSSFNQQANRAVMDITGDDDAELRRMKTSQKWDRKRKKFTSDTSGDKKSVKKIRTESGVLVPATYKTNIYQQWLNKSKKQEVEDMDSGDEANDVTSNKRRGLVVLGHVKRRGKGFHQKSNVPGNPRGGELKTKEQILKLRKIKGRKQAIQKKQERKHKIKKASFGGRR